MKPIFRIRRIASLAGGMEIGAVAPVAEVLGLLAKPRRKARRAEVP